MNIDKYFKVEFASSQNCVKATWFSGNENMTIEEFKTA